MVLFFNRNYIYLTTALSQYRKHIVCCVLQYFVVVELVPKLLATQILVDRMFYRLNDNVLRTRFNDRMHPIYPQYSRIKISKQHVSVKSCNRSVMYVQRVTFRLSGQCSDFTIVSWKKWSIIYKFENRSLCLPFYWILWLRMRTAGPKYGDDPFKENCNYNRLLRPSIFKMF